MIEHWTTKVFDVMGWPEWDDVGTHFWLQYFADGIDGEPPGWAEQSREDGGTCEWPLAPHLAHCVIRDWAREYLRKFHLGVGWDVGPERWFIEYDEARTPEVVVDRLEEFDEKTSGVFDDEDLALATAVRATRGHNDAD